MTHLAGTAIFRQEFQALSSLCYLLMTSGKVGAFHSCVWDVMFGGHIKSAGNVNPVTCDRLHVLCIEDMVSLVCRSFLLQISLQLCSHKFSSKRQYKN